jgi:fibronectin-binding autotransporter adhesin
MRISNSRACGSKQTRFAGRKGWMLMMAVAPLAVLMGTHALGATQTWDPAATTTGSDGLGSWDATSTDWASGGADGVWVNDGTSTANFGSGGTVGTVTINTPNISAAGINFNLGYTVAATTGDTLTLTTPTVTVAAGQTATISAPLVGAVGLTAVGNLTLTTASTYTGDTTISSGSLVTVTGSNSGAVIGTNTVGVGIDSALGVTTAGSGNITVANGGTLSLNGTANNVINFGSKVVFIAGTGSGPVTVGAKTFSGAIINQSATIREFDAFEFLTLTGDATVGGSRIDIGRDGDGGVAPTRRDVLDLAGHTLTINMNGAAQPVFGIEGLNGKGNSVGTTVTSGNIDVVGGSLDIETNTVVQNDGTSTITFESGANLELFETSGTSLNRAMVFKGNNVIGGGANLTNAVLGSNVTLNGNISFETDVSGGLQAGGTANLTITGNIVESGGSYSISQIGASTTTLAGTNNYTGGTFIQHFGTLALGSAGALPVGTVVTMGNATTGSGGTLDLGGQNTTVGGLVVVGIGASTCIIGNSSTTAPSTLNFAGNATPSVFPGTIQDVVGVGSQTTALAVSAGSLTLTGSNTYSGGTTVSGGKLLVNSSAGSGNVTLNGGVLGGTGFINGSVVAGTGAHTIHPGPGGGVVGSLFIGGDLVTNANTTLAFDLASPGGGSDLLAVTGNVTLSGGALAIASQGTTGSGSLGYYRVISYSGSLTGSTSGFVLPAVAGNIAYTLSTTQDSGYIDIHRGFVGDTNDDGNVDANDLNVVLANLGTKTSSWGNGNFDGATTIDLTDLNDVLNHLGTSVGSNSLAGSTAVAPEPATLGIAVFGAAALMIRRKRR